MRTLSDINQQSTQVRFKRSRLWEKNNTSISRSRFSWTQTERDNRGNKEQCVSASVCACEYNKTKEAKSGGLTFVLLLLALNKWIQSIRRDKNRCQKSEGEFEKRENNSGAIATLREIERESALVCVCVREWNYRWKSALPWYERYIIVKTTETELHFWLCKNQTKP